jgi:hypothetical protein
MYFISSVAGSWIVFILRPEIHNPLLPVAVAAAGALVLALAGGLLAWLRVRKALWIGLFGASAAVLLFLMLRSYPSLERALAKNGSWWAYVCSAVELGIYAATVLSGITTLVSRVAGRSRNPPA